MIDQDAVRLARQRVEIEAKEQADLFSRELLGAVHDLSRRGMLRAGGAGNVLLGICVRFMAARAQLVWETYHRFLATAGVVFSSALSEEIKDALRVHFPSDGGDLMRILEERARPLAPAAAAAAKAGFTNAMRSSVAKMENEIDLFSLSVKQNAAATSASTGHTTVNVYSPVGSIQTGANSVATVSQHISGEIKTKLTGALDKIESSIASTSGLDGATARHLQGLVEKGRAELESPTPSVPTLKDTLLGMATTIQTLGSAAPAYAAVKAALAYLNIPMP